jgi:peptidoglycan hydrolase-like protein with peptidoglycan-binding domain
MTPYTLKSKYWAKWVTGDKDQNRLQLAANAPFHSVHAASNDNGSTVITGIQNALVLIEEYSNLIISPLDGSNSWGPFPLKGSETDSATFGPSTVSSVRTFQKQATIAQDGKVGMDTFTCLDSILVEIQSAVASASSDDGDDSNNN